MKNRDRHNQDINDKQDELNAKNADVNARDTKADAGFKTGKKSHGMTWENPLDEQSFDDNSISRDRVDEEGD
jgi:hypothetical protein